MTTTLKVDSREQKPLWETSDSTSTFNVVVEGMPVGDYWFTWPNGEEMPVCFERKSIPDLFQTLTRNIDRFKREIEKANDFGLKIILIIEGSVNDVLAGIPQSSVKGESILKTIFTLWVKYDLMPVFCNNRQDMKRFIWETFSAISRNYTSEKFEKFGGCSGSPTVAYHPTRTHSPTNQGGEYAAGSGEGRSGAEEEGVGDKVSQVGD